MKLFRQTPAPLPALPELDAALHSLAHAAPPAGMNERLQHALEEAKLPTARRRWLRLLPAQIPAATAATAMLAMTLIGGAVGYEWHAKHSRSTPPILMPARSGGFGAAGAIHSPSTPVPLNGAQIKPGSGPLNAPAAHPRPGSGAHVPRHPILVNPRAQQ